MTSFNKFLESKGLPWNHSKQPTLSDFIEYAQFLLKEVGDLPLRYTTDNYTCEKEDVKKFNDLDYLISYLPPYREGDEQIYFIGG